MTLASLLALVTRRALLRTLRHHHGSRALTARTLGISRSTLLRLLAQHVTADELATLASRHGWPTREELAAHARSARVRRAFKELPERVRAALDAPP